MFPFMYNIDPRTHFLWVIGINKINEHINVYIILYTIIELKNEELL